MSAVAFTRSPIAKWSEELPEFVRDHLGLLVRREVTAARQLAVYAAATMEDHVERSQAVYRRRSMLVVLGALATAALLLVMIGIYGVIAYGVAQRMREIAIRVALGATRANVVRLVMRHGLRLLIAGLTIGILAALAASRALSSLLFGVHENDLWTYSLTAALVVIVTLAASYLPARRAIRFDPAISLRSE